LAEDTAQGSRQRDVPVEHVGDVARLCGPHATSGSAAWTCSAETVLARARAAASSA
jgi:hypothetical protein